jgi:hypothetical protein
VANVAVSEGVREGLASERTSVTLTPGASGSFNATANGGYLFYAAYFDLTTNDLGASYAVSRQRAESRKFSQPENCIAVLPEPGRRQR